MQKLCLNSLNVYIKYASKNKSQKNKYWISHSCLDHSIDLHSIFLHSWLFHENDLDWVVNAEFASCSENGRYYNVFKYHNLI